MRKDRGITLIALVVTIIVLLILACISISMLTGQNGILNRALEAKEKTLLSSEKEAISLSILQDTMNTNANESENRIGKKLYSKNFANSDKWDYIYLQTDGKIYGDKWYYINKGTNIENYGKAQKEWLVNYSDGEIIELEEEKYTEVSVNNVLITDGLVFNLDSNDFSVSDKSTWGDGVEAVGFDNNQEDSDGISFDGVDDYVSFKSGTDFQKGFTISFYGIKKDDYYFFTKQKEENTAYSCRFGINKYVYFFNTSKNQANSNWSNTPGEANNGNLSVDGNYKIGDVGYLDLTFNPDENMFILYNKGVEIARTTTDYNYWNGTDGGRQIFEDDTIYCYVGRGFGGGTQGVSEWLYSKLSIYNLKLYNRNLSSTEIMENYMKTIAYHQK